MLKTELNLPSDVDQLRALVVELHQERHEDKIEIRYLNEKIKQLIHQLYGRKSEKLFPDDHSEQSSLFDDAGTSDNAEPASVDEIITVPSHTRKKKGGRKILSQNLPCIEIEHDITESEKQCGCGSQMIRIGQETSERLEMVPAHFWVERHIRPKYACKNCEGVESDDSSSNVKIAACPPQLLPKTISSPSLLSHVFVAKFCDSLPFYRQETQFLRLGFSLTRATMCNWAIKVAEKCKPLIDLLHQEILSGPLINIDESWFQVLKEEGRSPESNSFIWVYRGGIPDRLAVIYRYNASRSGTEAREFLGDYRGNILTDGYSGYDFLDIREGIVHAGCWAHVRRKYIEVTGSKNVKNKLNLSGMGKAGKALQFIQELYAIEANAKKRGLGPELLRVERQLKSKPILDEFREWLTDNGPQIAPKSLLGKAFIYTQSQWHRLIKYLDDGTISIDNNWAENAVRPFVVGRKNWLFADTIDGAKANAALYSLIETAKCNGLEPYQYFCYLFEKLPVAQNEDQLKTLLPMNLTVELLEEHQKAYRQKGELAVKKI